MEQTVQQLLVIAQSKFPDQKILPCGTKDSFHQCITEINLHGNSVFGLWFNTEDGNTHVVLHPKPIAS